MSICRYSVCYALFGRCFYPLSASPLGPIPPVPLPPPVPLSPSLSLRFSPTVATSLSASLPPSPLLFRPTIFPRRPTSPAAASPSSSPMSASAFASPPPALSVLFACSQVTSCPVARTFGPFCWQAGRTVPRCQRFCRFSLAGGTFGAVMPAEIPGQARNEVEVAPE